MISPAIQNLLDRSKAIENAIADGLNKLGYGVDIPNENGEMKFGSECHEVQTIADLVKRTIDANPIHRNSAGKTIDQNDVSKIDDNFDMSAKQNFEKAEETKRADFWKNAYERLDQTNIALKKEMAELNQKVRKAFEREQAGK